MNIKKIRQSANMTQRQFAEYMGVGVSTVKSWEGGRTSPSPRHVEKLRAMTLGDIVTVEAHSALVFTRQCRDYLGIGYNIDSTFCSSDVWRAVLVKQ